MKTAMLVLAALASVAPLAWAAGANTNTIPSDTAYHEVERGANYKVWQRETYQTRPDGQAIPQIHKYVELASGMHYQNAKGAWVESKELIESCPGGAQAVQGQYQVKFANNLNSYGAIDVGTVDGKRLRSNVLGLGYYNKITGDSVLIARVHDSQGQLVADNQVVYTNAFEGVNADVLYSFKKGSFEQDIILRAQPPTPESFGLDSATTELEVMTEFLNPPAATVKASGGGHVGEKNGQEDDGDLDISWGAMRLGHGRAFDLDEDQVGRKQVPVRRQYGKLSGRNILLEIIPVQKMQADLQKLPQQSSVERKHPSMVAKSRTLPVTPLKVADAKPIRLATTALPGNGYVLDYIEVNGDTNDFTFRGDTTYYISGGVNFNGTVTYEGGTVLKFEPTVDDICIQMWGAVVCNTEPYQPAVCTTVNDNEVGQILAAAPPWGGALPGKTNYHEAFAGNSTTSVLWHDFIFRYADYGVQADHGLKIRDCQFADCKYALWNESGNCYATNLLMKNVESAFVGEEYNVTACHVTVQGYQTNLFCRDFGVAWGWYATSPSTITLINSLLVNVGADGEAAVTTNYTARVTADPTTIFQTAVAGHCYLPTNSPYRNMGTTNLDAGLLARLAHKTTSAPIVYSNITFTTAMTFTPQAQRDTDIPDLGYHYDPLDYALVGCVASSNITVTAGTALGWYVVTNCNALTLNNDVTINFNGTATAPCIFARHSTAQEGSRDDGLVSCFRGVSYAQGGIVSGGNYSTNHLGRLVAQFTHLYALNLDTGFYNNGSNILAVQATHCEIYGGNIQGYNFADSFTNCLFVNMTCYPLMDDSDGTNITSQQVFLNCTFENCFLGVFHSETPPLRPVYIQNCAFDGTIIDLFPGPDATPDWTWLTADYNAFYNSAFYQEADLTAMPGAHNQNLTAAYNWQSSWLGNYYLPADSPLINAGGQTADRVGLYEFTTQTNQVQEGISKVDIGYHYVALDSNGNPITTFTNDVPDYLADANGNGLPDWWEWQWFGAYTNTASQLDYTGTRTLLQDWQNGYIPVVPNAFYLSQLLTANNLGLWLKADSIAASSNNAPVSTWFDRSGWGNNVAQASTNGQPLYVTNVLNGLPAVQFNGSQYFVVPNFMAGYTGAEVYVVLNSTLAAGNNQMLWNVNAGNFYPRDDGSISESFANNSSYNLGVPVQPLSQYNIYNVAGQPGYWAAWLNGQMLGTTTNNTPSFGTGTWYFGGLGNFWNFNGNVAEMLIFNRVLTLDERAAVSGYLNAKYGLGLAAVTTPSNLVANAISPTQVSLHWDEVLTNGGLTQISIERKAGDSGVYAEVGRVLNALSYLDTNVLAGTKYTYRVREEAMNQWGGYSGEAVVSTPQTGTAVPFGNLGLWVCADAGLNQGGTGTRVSFWGDQSGNGNNLTQGAVGTQPVWVPNAINGRPVVQFNGNQYFIVPNFLAGYTGAEVYVVLNSTIAAGNRQMLWNVNAGNYYPNEDGSISESFANNSSYNLGVPVQPLSQYNIYNVSVQPGYWAAWLDGQMLGSTTNNTPSFGTGTWYFGGMGPFWNFNGNVAEMLIFNRVLTADERRTVNQYLNGKYGLVPTVAILTPTNNSVYVTGSNIGLSASAVETAGGSIRQVEYFQGTNSLGISTSAPYAVTWTNVAAGASTTNSFALTAVVTGVNGLMSTSAVVNIRVDPPPVVAIAMPANNSYLGGAPIDVPIQVSASAAMGLRQVELFQGATSLVVLTNAPYNWVWSQVPAGSYTITAVATGNDSFTTTSTPVNFMLDVDSDGDGLGDTMEQQWGTNPNAADQPFDLFVLQPAGVELIP